MATEMVTLDLPVDLYNKLQKLADVEQTDPVEIIARLVEASAKSGPSELVDDPVFELIGAYHSDQPQIDDIPASEDPDLYLAAAAMGERAANLHAWEIAPARYKKGPGGRPIRQSSIVSESKEYQADEAEE